MEILLLGDSDTAGIRIAGPSWPELLKADLDSDGGGAVTIHTVMFTPVPASAAAYAERRARERNVDMPISSAVAAVLAEKLSVDEAIESLLARPLRSEE